MWWAQLLNNVVALLGNGAGGGGGSFESIATATGTGSSGTITFSSIPSTYKHLQIRIQTLGTAAGAETWLTLNGSTTGYTQHKLWGNGTSVYADGLTGGANALIGWYIGTETTYPTVSIIDIHDYASTTKNKTIRGITGIDKNGSGYVGMISSLWQNTAAVNSISLVVNGTNFATTTKIALYGIKGE